MELVLFTCTAIHPDFVPVWKQGDHVRREQENGPGEVNRGGGDINGKNRKGIQGEYGGKAKQMNKMWWLWIGGKHLQIMYPIENLCIEYIKNADNSTIKQHSFFKWPEDLYGYFTQENITDMQANMQFKRCSTSLVIMTCKLKLWRNPTTHPLGRLNEKDCAKCGATGMLLSCW